MGPNRDEKDSIECTLHAYAEAFSRGDAAAVARFCQVPFLLISADRVVLANSPAEVEHTYMSIITALRERGFVRTEFIQLHINLHGPALALASAQANRYFVTDTELEQIGATYLLRKIANLWGIVVLAVYSPDVLI